MRDQAHLMTESELQGTIIRMAQERGWLVHSASQGSRAGGAVKGTQRNRTGNGFPDLVLARDTEYLFLELKTQDGKVGEDQVKWMLALPKYEVIRPSDLARGRVDELLA